MGEWKECKLGDLIEIKHGYAFKGEYICNEKMGHILVTPGNFHIGGGFKATKFKFYNADVPTDYILKKDDLVVTMTDLSKEGDTLGFSAKIPDIQNIKFLHNQRIGLVSIKSNFAAKDFIYWLMRTREYQGFIVGGASGTSIKHTSPTRIKEYEFNCPPLPEQKAIAEVLSSLDDKIDLLHRQNKTLEALAETLFRQWFVEGENTGSISQLISIQNGYAFKSRDFQEAGNNGVIKIKNISGGIINIEQTDFIDSIVASTIQERFKIDSGDVLIAMTGAEIGKLGIIPKSNKKLWLNQRVGLLKGKYKGSKYLAYLQLKSEFGQDYIENTATGSAQPNISGVAIENCGFPKLSEPQIIEYSSHVEELYEKLIFNLGQIQSLEKLRDTLLPKLMSGEVRVKSEVLESQDNVIYISDYIKSIKEKSKKSCEEKGFVDIKKIAGDCNIIVLKDISVKKAQIRYENPHYIIHANDLTDSFSIAHELAHYVQDRETIKKQAVGRKDEFSLTESKEKEIDSLAAEFVMPEEYIRAFIDNNIKNKNIVIGNKLISKCAKQFRVNPPAVQYRLNNLGYKTTNKH